MTVSYCPSYTVTATKPVQATINYKYYNVKTLVLYFSLILVILSQILVRFSYQQSSISLNSAQWFVSNSNNSILIPATVPGGIYTDLRKGNVLKQDILYGKNDVAYRWVGNENWSYSTTFTIDHQIAKSQSVKLVFHGVDTISTVFINGQELGTTDNMFVRYKFDIKPHLKLPGLPNTLVIKFESPIKYSARKSNQSIRENRGKIIPPYCPSPSQRGECHVNFIRKMQASFSWDWGPAFPSVGLYKDVTLEYGSFGIIRDILVETRRIPAVYHPIPTTTPAPPMIISSTLKQHFKTTPNRTVPYMRAPPYYIGPDRTISRKPLLEQPDIALPSETSKQLVEENWLLKITLVAEMVQPSFGYNVRIEFSLDNTLHYESEHINVVANSDGFIRLGFNLRIDTSRMLVKPWWPNNAGNQTLYQLTARMMPIPNPIVPPDNKLARSAEPVPSDGFLPLQFRNKPHQTPAIPAIIFLATSFDMNARQISQKDIMFGFRTVELIQEPINKGNPDDGLTFNLRINSIDLFAMGSNWIPSSILPEYSNDIEYARYLLQSTKDANMNMLRVWGGGLYESDEFYRLADEMGIMIWHDFMFACALYPTDEDYLASVRLEIEQQVQRLQHHPSIMIWVGNNEIEQAISGPWWPEVVVWSKKLKEDYAKMFVETIRPIVQILDPSRPYLESSPSNGVFSQSQPYAIARSPQDNKFGDVHHYDYLADSFDWTNYPNTRFASEYGFQSYPSFNALTSISSPSDWKYPLTSNILHRQHRLTGQTEMKLQMKMHFKDIDSGGVDKFKTYIYVSQLTQALAIKTETEFYRRNRFIDPETNLGKTMGALYWQLNDVWQAPTWSSIEYGGKWKMLHYFARRFFFPIQVMPYLVQQSSGISSVLQQAISASSNFISSLHNRLQYQNEPQQQQQKSTSTNQLFVIDLVRDDLFYLLDSFNITIKFFRYTSFTPVFQEMIFIERSRPQNVTRIYEQDISRILRQAGGTYTLSSGVFQVVIDAQPHIGLSQIDNYLLPVPPSRITAMRVPKISARLIQGPFELTDVKRESLSGGSSSQWSCAYRLTIVSDSIAMFVWLDLNLLNIANGPSGPFEEEDNTLNTNVNLNPPFTNPALNLDAFNALVPEQSDPLLPTRSSSPSVPDHIRFHLNQQEQRPTFDREPSARRQSRMQNPDALREIPANLRRRHRQQSTFKPIEGTGSNMLRYQFSDNAFHMFEPSAVVDLYLNRCLSKTQIELSLEIQTLTDTL